MIERVKGSSAFRPRSKSTEISAAQPTEQDLETYLSDHRNPLLKNVSPISKDKYIEETSDQLSPLIKYGQQKKLLQRSYSLDSDPQYQQFIYGTFVPFPVLRTPVIAGPCNQNSIITIFAIWNTIIGSSLLAMPWSVQRAGLLMAFILMLAISSLAVYTAYRLLLVQSEYGSDISEVPCLCRLLLGAWAEKLARIFSFLIIFGANTVYWILMANFLYHTVTYVADRLFGVQTDQSNIFGNDTVLCPRQAVVPSSVLLETPEKTLFQKIWNLEYTVPVFLAFIVSPLVNFKSATFFTKFNSIGTCSVMYLVVFVLTKCITWGVNLEWTDELGVHFFRFYENTFVATSGMLPLSLFIHNIIITVMKTNRYQQNNFRDLSVAYLLVVLTYIVIGFTFYVSFPLAKSCIQDNMLNNFPSGDIMTVVARVFLLFQLLTVFPLLSYMLRIQIFSALNYPSYPSAFHVAVLNLVNVSLCVLVAIFLPRIGTIIRFTGAMCGFVYIFLLPNLLHIAVKNEKRAITPTMLIVHIGIPILGLVNLVAQFFVTDS